MAVKVTNWMNGVDYNAADDRLLISGLTMTPGVDGHKSMYVSQKATPTMKADISAGSAFVDGTSVAHQGQYHVYNDGTAEVQFDAAHATMNRIDLVSLVVEDTQYTGITPPVTRFIVTTGRPASSPVRPISPPDSLDLASVLVKKGATKISNSDIQNISPRATTLGGIAYARNYMEMTEKLPRIDGLHVYRKDINRLMVCDGVSWSYINVKPERDTGWMPINISKKYQIEPTQYRVYGDIVFTRGAVKNWQKEKKNQGSYKHLASINKKYAPGSSVRVNSQLESPVRQGVAFRPSGEILAFTDRSTSGWIVLSTSWLLG